jgi:hypothetical protein
VFNERPARINRPDNQQAFRIAQSIAAKRREALKQLLGKNYSRDFVYVRQDGETYVVNTSIPQSVSQLDKQAFRQFINYELSRGVSEEFLTDLGLDFLQTPSGIIYGFTTPQGDVYIDSEISNMEMVDVLFTSERLQAESREAKYEREFDRVFPYDVVGGYIALVDPLSLKESVSKGTQPNNLGKFIISEVDNNTLKLEEIITFNRGKRTGAGKKGLNAILALTDRNGFRVELVANPILEMRPEGLDTSEKLMEFYSRFGFERVGKSNKMIREVGASKIPTDVKDAVDFLAENTKGVRYQQGKGGVTLANTAIHEYGHLWNKFTKQNNPELFKRGLELVKGTEYEKRVRENSFYQNLSEEEVLEEALALAIGEKGEQIVEQTKKDNFSSWLSELWNFIREALGINEYTAEQLQDITLEQFTEGVVVDLLRGKNLIEQAQVSEQNFKERVSSVLQQVKNITKIQAESLSEAVSVIAKNIANRMGISVEEYSRRTSINTVADLDVAVRNTLEAFSMYGATETLYQSEVEKDYQVNQKYLNKKNGVKGLTKNDFWLAKVIELSDLIDQEKLHTLGDVETVRKEIATRLDLLIQELKTNIDNYTVKYLTEDLVDRRIAEAESRNEVNQVQHWTEFKNNENYRNQVLEQMAGEQKTAILANVSYLENNSDYSTEFKYLALLDMTRNRYSLDNEGNIKSKRVKPSDYKRDETPVKQFNYGALSRTYHNHGNKGSFKVGASHLYEVKNAPKITVSNSKFSKYKTKTIEGQGYWLKFPKGEDSQVANDLYEITSTSHKYPAQWCTGGSSATALSQLKGGDFYVFVDEKTGDARVAVRYDGDKIGEIRGLGEGQSILPEDEPVMNDIVNNLPDGKSYKQYHDVQKNLVRLKNNEVKLNELSISDLLDILKVKDRSYNNSDALLNNVKKQITPEFLTENGYYKEGEVVSASSLEVKLVGGLKNTNNIKLVIGSLTLSGATIPEGFKLGDVGGYLDLSSATIPEGFTVGDVSGDLYLTGATIPKGFTVGDVSGDLYLSGVVVTLL